MSGVSSGPGSAVDPTWDAIEFADNPTANKANSSNDQLESILPKPGSWPFLPMVVAGMVYVAVAFVAFAVSPYFGSALVIAYLLIIGIMIGGGISAVVTFYGLRAAGREI